MKYKQKSSSNNTALVTIRGIELVVQYDYSPAEPMTWTEQGCSEQFDIWAVQLATVSAGVEMAEQGLDIKDLTSDEFLAEIEVQLAEQHRDYHQNYFDDY